MVSRRELLQLFVTLPGVGLFGKMPRSLTDVAEKESVQAVQPLALETVDDAAAWGNTVTVPNSFSRANGTMAAEGNYVFTPEIIIRNRANGGELVYREIVEAPIHITNGNSFQFQFDLHLDIV
jgi:hypothetical protein